MRFPAGSVYSKIAGSVSQALVLDLHGVLPFQFPFFYAKVPTKSWEQKKLAYRRHHLYLRHGLDWTATGNAELTVQQLAKLKAAVSVTGSDGAAMDFSLSLVDKATLQIEMPSHMPNK